jgi:quinol monooxygenase YgiN
MLTGPRAEQVRRRPSPLGRSCLRADAAVTCILNIFAKNGIPGGGVEIRNCGDLGREAGALPQFADFGAFLPRRGGIPEKKGRFAELKFGCKGEITMVKYALYVPLKAKSGKEIEVEQFLQQGAELAKKEPGTVTWYAIREGDGHYAIFDTFNDEAGREAHLNGEIAKALTAKASTLLAEPPKIHKIDVLAAK